MLSPRVGVGHAQLATDASDGSPTVSAAAELVLGELHALLEETKKLEGIGQAIAGLLTFSQHDNVPNVKELCTDALTDLQQRKSSLQSVEQIRKPSLYLRPFIAACEQKHQRLVPLALATLAKLVQRRLISHDGRMEIVKMLITRVEKVRDERALLLVLQICLALLQDPNYADDEQGIGQLLSLVLRVHDAHAVQMPTVAHTASSTVRQAVALIFDHAMMPADNVGVSLGFSPSLTRRLEPRPGPGPYKDMDGMTGREVAALKLLKDLVMWAGSIDKQDKQHVVQWLVCKPPASEFLLDLLDIILRERAQAFHLMPRFTVALRTDVCTTLGALLRSALAERLSPAETIRTLRCVGAVLRKHVTLAPDKCAVFFQDLLRCLQSVSTHVLVRCHVLDIFRGICADPMLTYRLFEMYDQAMDFDLNVVTDMLSYASKYPEQMLRRAADPHNQYRDEYLSRLDGYYNYRALEGKDPASLIMELHPLSVESSSDADVLPAFLGLEVSANVASSMEQLAVRVRGADALAQLQHSHPGDREARDRALRSSGTLRWSADAMGPQQSSPLPTTHVRQNVLANMVDMLWRPMVGLLDPFLQLTDKRSENAMTQPLVTTYQYIIYAAGVVHMQHALDGLLAQLCAYAISGPEDKAYKEAKQMASQYLGGPLLLNTLSTTQMDVHELWPKNRTVLKAVLELTKRLAEDLGSGWMYVLDVINCLNRYLDMPSAKWKNENDRPDDGFKRGGFLLVGAEAERERPKPGTGKDLLKEKEQWRVSCDEVFVTSRRLSQQAVVGLMAALYEVSFITLSDSWRPFQEAHKLDMLKLALQVLAANLHLTRDLWRVFLNHCMLVLHSSNAQARAAALKYLEEGIMRALSPEAATAQEEALVTPTASRAAASFTGMPFTASVSQTETSARRSISGHVEGDAGEEATPHGIQRMLLVAVESLFRDCRLSVQLGLLNIVLHVLQRYGEDLTRGWEPLLNLLEAAAATKDVSVLTLGWECMHLLCNDYLYMLPSERVPQALDVLASFAKQDLVLNISLTAVTMLWNVADTLARARGLGGPAAQANGKPIPLSLIAKPGPSPVTAAAGQRSDLSEAARVELLLQAFRNLTGLGLDARPEVRNSAVRTLFMAFGSHSAKFPPRYLRECMWDMMLHLVVQCQQASLNSSSSELGPSEIGKDKEGKVVTMLMHHSRNTEQKLWEETLTLTIAGATKVLRAHLPAVMQLEGWQDAWAKLIEVVATILAHPRKGLCTSCTTFISTLITTHGSNPNVMPAWQWRSALQALAPAVAACAAPSAAVPITVRTELLSCITVVHAALKEQLSAADAIMVLGWLDRFARYPFGTEDNSVLLPGLSPIQKATLAALQQLAPPPAGVWPDLLHTLTNMLCPFQLLPYRLAEQTSQTPTSAVANKSAATTGYVTPVRISRSAQQRTPASRTTQQSRPAADAAASRTSSAATPAAVSQATGDPGTERRDVAQEARALNSVWMSRIAELAAKWYKELVPWQVRVVTFAPLVAALSECMAMRYVEPNDDLWRIAATALIAVVQSGLPSINIAAHSQLSTAAVAASPLSVLTQPSHSISSAAAAAPDTWPVLVRAFEIILLGQSLPAPIPSLTMLQSSGGSGYSDSSSSSTLQPVSDIDIQASLLDCLADTVLTSCQYAPAEIRSALVSIVDMGADKVSPVEADMHATARFTHACLSKLYVLCSRGWDTWDHRERGAAGGSSGSLQETYSSRRSSSSSMATGPQELGLVQAYARGSGPSLTSRPSVGETTAMPKDQNARCLIEVAQLALPAFISRCENVLQAYIASQHSSGMKMAEQPPSAPDTPTQQGSDQALLVDRTIHALDLLGSLRVSSTVMDAFLASRIELKPWAELARSHRRRSNATGTDRREQMHLLPLYGLCADLLLSDDLRVRTHVRCLLLSLGRELGLPLGLTGLGRGLVLSSSARSEQMGDP